MNYVTYFLLTLVSPPPPPTHHELQPHEQRLSVFCDLFINNFICGGHTTAADALWAGLFLLTLRGYGVAELLRRGIRRLKKEEYTIFLEYPSGVEFIGVTAVVQIS